MEDPASSAFAEGYNCAQAVFSAHSPALGLDRSSALKIASGLGAGMGRRQEVCGAVSGGALVLGLRYGFDQPGDRPGRERVYSLTRELMERFASERGSTVCRQLLGCDLMTEAGQVEFASRGLLNQVCQPCVASAYRIVRTLLEENP